MAMYHGHMKTVTATEYKHNALKLLKQVRDTGEAIQITNRGEPVGRLCPEENVPNKRVFGASRGLATNTGDIVGPIVDPEEWGDLAF